MHNFKMIGKMYREIAGLDKGILPVDFFCAILTGCQALCEHLVHCQDHRYDDCRCGL